MSEKSLSRFFNRMTGSVLEAVDANPEELGVMRLIVMQDAPESVVIDRVERCVSSGASRYESRVWSKCFEIAVMSHRFGVADHLLAKSSSVQSTFAKCVAALHDAKLFPAAAIAYLFQRGGVSPAALSNPSEILWSISESPFGGDVPFPFELALLDEVLGTLVAVGGRFNLHGCSLYAVVQEVNIRGPILGEVADIFFRHMKSAGQVLQGGHLAIEDALGEALTAESVSGLVRAVLAHTDDIRDLAEAPDPEMGPLLHHAINSVLIPSFRSGPYPDSGFIGIVQMLVDREWPLEVKDRFNQTPLAHALGTSGGSYLQDPSQGKYESWLDAKMKVAKVLLEAGADTRAPIGISDTPLIEQALRCPETLEAYRGHDARSVEWEDLWCVVPPQLKELLLEYDARRYGSKS